MDYSTILDDPAYAPEYPASVAYVLRMARRILKSIPECTSVAWENVTRKPYAFNPEPHTHGNTDLTGLSDWAKAAQKPTYTAAEVGAAASSHTHGNTDLTGLSDWAKAAQKPTYSADEVDGAVEKSDSIPELGVDPTEDEVIDALKYMRTMMAETT